MHINYADIEDAFNFVCFGQHYDHQAFLCKETGRIYWYSEFGDSPDELPADIDDPKYIEIPNKNELGLGKRMVLDFAYAHLSDDDIHSIESMFQRKGAYSRFKDFLIGKGLIDKWHAYENQAQEIALRKWCQMNDIMVQNVVAQS